MAARRFKRPGKASHQPRAEEISNACLPAQHSVGKSDSSVHRRARVVITEDTLHRIALLTLFVYYYDVPPVVYHLYWNNNNDVLYYNVQVAGCYCGDCCAGKARNAVCAVTIVLWFNTTKRRRWTEKTKTANYKVNTKSNQSNAALNRTRADR